MKEGHEVTLNRVMEIARLEVSMQQHLDRMQETAKVNYVQYGRSTKSKKKKPQSSAGGDWPRGRQSQRGRWPQGIQWQITQMTSSPTWHLLLMWERENITRHRTARLWTLLAEGVARKGHYKKVCLQGKCSAHSLEIPQTDFSRGWRPVNPYTSTMRDNQFTLTWLVFPMQNKHLIRFPIAIEPTSTEEKGHTHGFFSLYTLCIAQGRYRSRCQPNQQEDFLINSLTAKVLKPTPIRMENYRNSTVKVLGMFHAFLRWKSRVYKQLFYM